MADPILSSALTGDADFAGTIFGRGPEPKEAPDPPVKSMDDPDPDVDIVNGVPQSEDVKPEAKEEEEKPAAKKTVAPKTSEPKKPKATTKETGDKVVKATERATKLTKTEDPAENVPAGELPVNPHFQDKKVAEAPEGDDSEKGISSWKEIKSEMKKAREERDRLKAELDAAKERAIKFEEDKSKTFQEEIDNYKTQLAELNRELKLANFERSPEYTERVRKPIADMQSDVKEIAEANDVDFGKLWQAIAEPDTRKRTDLLEDITSDFKRMEQLAVIRMSEKYQDLYSYHKRMEQEAQAMNDELQARKAQQEQEFIENDVRLQKAFLNKNWTTMEDKYDFLREVDGQDQWNSYIQNAKKGASETNLDRLSVEDRSAILAKAAVVPFLESALTHYTSQLEKVSSEKDEKIRELETQLKSFTGATPSFGKSSEESEIGEDEDDASLTNFGASIFGRR